MKIIESLDNDILILSLEGNFDDTTSPMIEEAFENCLENQTTNICFDLGKVNYISSAGIRVLIASYKKAVKQGKKVLISHMSNKTRDILEMVGILPLFNYQEGQA